MALSIDDVRRLQAAARERFEVMRERCFVEFMKPEIDRATVNEYDSLTDEDHARIYSARGEQDYRAWVEEVERLRAKQEGQRNGKRLGQLAQEVQQPPGNAAGGAPAAGLQPR